MNHREMTNLLKGNLTKWVAEMVRELQKGVLVPYITSICHPILRKLLQKKQQMPFNSKEKSNSWGKTKERYTLGKKKKKKNLDNNTTKTLKYFAFLFFFLLHCLHNNVYMNMFNHYSKGLVYGSSLLITLRNDKLFKNGFRLNFRFDLKLSFKSSRIHARKKKINLIFSFWNTKRKQTWTML